MLRYHLERQGKGTVSNAMAVREVAKQVYAKYFHDTVFCVSVSTIQRRVEKLRKTFSVGRMRNDERQRRIKRQFVSACTHRATTCFLHMYVCLYVCNQSKNSKEL